MNKNVEIEKNLSDLRNSLTEKRKALEGQKEEIKKVEADIQQLTNKILEVKQTHLRKYLFKCATHLYTRPGVDWFKIMPVTLIGGSGFVVITKYKSKPCSVQIYNFSSPTFEGRNSLWLQDFLFMWNGRKESVAIKETKSQKHLFKTINTILRSCYSSNNALVNGEIKKALEALLFCYENPYLKIG